MSSTLIVTPVRLLLLVVALAVLVCTAAAEEDLGNEVCLSCHGMEGFEGASGEPLTVDEARFDASAHGGFPCTSCHVDATEVPHAELKPVGLDTCAGCHEDSVAAYRAGVHGAAAARGIDEAPTCASCHGTIHGVLPSSDPASSAHWSHLTETCAQCHAKIELAQKFGIPVVRPVEAYLESAHARAVAAGQHGAVCGDCHGVHDVLPGSDPRSRIARANVPTTCGGCHDEVMSQFLDSVHGVAFARGHRGAPVCTDCHGEHRILGASDRGSPVFAVNIPGETCGRCHGDERLSEKYGLALGTVTAFRDSFHGLALRAGRPTVANCASCHGVHDILQSSDPRSRVHPANLAATCGECHPGAGTYFAIGSVHGAPDSTGVWAVSWVRFLYLWLIGGTVGLMLLHNALDMSIKVRRPRPPPPPSLPVRERMSRGLRWQHGLVMVSFGVLVYTGFALTYPESWWAAPVLRWEEHYGLRGGLHRTAAVVLVVALLWHITHLVCSPRLRACMRNMLFSRQDIADGFGMLAYYLGRRDAPPHAGTFSYIEKVEYWAFMWGTVLMTVTGALLWFANFSLRYFPSWVTDVATAIHFYEAVLATLAILVWHFYWVIFDPDVYPMDWSWWNGRPPASRELERGPGGGGHFPVSSQTPAQGEESGDAHGQAAAAETKAKAPL